MILDQIHEFKKQYKEFFTKAIVEKFGSLDKFQTEKDYTTGKLNGCLSFDFEMPDELLIFIIDTGVKLSLKDDNENKVLYP